MEITIKLSPIWLKKVHFHKKRIVIIKEFSYFMVIKYID